MTWRRKGSVAGITIELKRLFFLPLLGLLGACSASIPAPVSSVAPDYDSIQRGSYRGSYYEVEKGDTLYFIAYLTDKDVKEIIADNRLSPPYTIHPGQKLNLWKKTYTPPLHGKKESVAVIVVKDKVPTVAVKSKPKKAEKKPIKKVVSTANDKKSVEYKKAAEYSSTVTKNKPSVEKIAKKKPNNSTPITWQWPTKGRMIAGFSSAERGNKGIDIAGQRAQSIVSSSDGKVVYAGNALRGYGNLIIIKHNDDYLSAYAHNDSIFVSEGQRIKKGQKIASMGSSATNSVRLHFEIRYKGKSVNPLRYLPKR